MLKDHLRRGSEDKQPSRSPADTPGAKFLGRSRGEQLDLVIGYLTAMDTVTSTVEAIRTTFVTARTTRKMTDEDIGCLVPDYLSEALRLWDFSEVELAQLTAFAVAIYTAPENAEIGLSNVLEVARDLCLHRITDKEAREQLEKLGSE